MRTLLMSTVWLDGRARAHIEREAVKRRLRETGGALFGWEDADSLVVACASAPGPKAKHRLRSFEPHRATTAEAMREVALASEGRYGYLGSWHTHPRGTPVPSSTDSATAADLASQEGLLLPRPLLLIVATTWRARVVRAEEARAWRWDRSSKRLRPAELVAWTLDELYCPKSALFASDPPANALVAYQRRVRS